MARSPIEIMVDKACGFDPNAPRPEPRKIVAVDADTQALMNDLSDDQCDRLVALTMNKLAEIHRDQYGTMHARDLNPSITEHHSLRRSIVRAAYEIGKLAGSTAGREMTEPKMFDALGAPRTRYVRVSLAGSHCVMRTSEGDSYLQDARDCGDDSEYTVADVYLSEREFEDLPDHDGF